MTRRFGPASRNTTERRDLHAELTQKIVAHIESDAGTFTMPWHRPGVAFTIVCSLGFGEAFGIYLNEFARNYVSTYAGLASVMIALVFLYVMAAIFIFGGELNAAIIRMKSGQYPKSNLRL